MSPVAIVGEPAICAGLVIENARLGREAQSAFEMREDFLSMASHELRTPLTGLRLQVSGMKRALAKNGQPDLQKIVSWVDNIDRQVGRLSDLVDGLLDASRASVGPLPLEIEDLDLGRVVRDVAERFCTELAARRCALSLDIEGAIVGRWDRAKLDEIVTKFLTNAIKYGAGKPIAISVRRAAAEVTIEVSDQGIGISLPDQERLFRRFSRVAPSRNYGGLGLGLWLAKLLVEAMNGRVEVQSVLGIGSCFRALLPLTASGRAS
jgi:signal transduction histidine kinase